MWVSRLNLKKYIERYKPAGISESDLYKHIIEITISLTNLTFRRKIFIDIYYEINIRNGNQMLFAS